MPSDIHSLMENAYHIDLPTARHSEKQDVGADGQFTITGPNVIRVASLPAPVRQSFAGLADDQNMRV